MIWVFDETYAFGNEYISSSLDDENKFVWKWPNRVLASVVPQRSTDIAVVLQLADSSLMMVLRQIFLLKTAYKTFC